MCLAKKIKGALVIGMSQESIAGRLKLEIGQQIISHKSIYEWIYGEGRKLALQRYLVRKKCKRGKKPCRKFDKIGIPEQVSIHNSPEIYKKKFGHREADTMYFSGTRETVVTLYERTTKITLRANMTTRITDKKIDFITTLLNPLLTEARRSITFDNSKRFTNHQQLQKRLREFRIAFEALITRLENPWNF